MNAVFTSTTARYARCIEASKRVRWTLDEVIQERSFDINHKFLPDTLAQISRFDSCSVNEKRFVSQIQGRTYANVFGLVERFINAKVLEQSRHHWFGDQTALQALVRFSDEELKHQELFREVEALARAVMPAGYRFLPQPDEVAGVVLSKSTWSVLALTYLIELFTQVHYKKSIEPDAELSPLFRDVFKFHFLEESQHATLDELEWRREDSRLTPEARDHAVDDLIALVAAVDSILVAQAGADADYFVELTRPASTPGERAELVRAFAAAYRYQYVFSGVQESAFANVLGELVSEPQMTRVAAALASLGM